MKRKLEILIVLSVTLLLLVTYWPVRNFEFLNYDDQFYVSENYRTQSGLTFRNVLDSFTDAPAAGNWHPITIVSHMLDWQLYGKNAGGHHWTSVVIHILNSALLFSLFRIMTGMIWQSAFVAALFAIHPINLESVAWIAERKNVLSTFFWLLTMLLYTWYVKSPNWIRYMVVLISFALGLMAKPMLVTLPFVLLLMDYWPLHRTHIAISPKNEEVLLNAKIWKEKVLVLVLEKVPLFILSGVFCYIVISAQRAAGAMVSTDSLRPMTRIFNALISYLLYVKKLFLPTDLSAFYPFEKIPVWQVIIAILFISIVTILVFRYISEYPYMAVGWFWYLGTLIPVIGIIQVGSQAMADRYAYVPFIGLFIMISWGFITILNDILTKKIVTTIILSILFCLTLISHWQLQFWRNNLLFYEHMIKTGKPSYLPHKNLGLHLINQNMPKEAAFHLKRAMEFSVDDPATLHNSLGVALLMMGNNSEAEHEFSTALRLDKKHAKAYNNLGMIYLSRGEVQESLKLFQEAIKIEPRFANAHYQLSKILKRKGFFEEADIHYHKAVQLNPEFKENQ